MIFIYIIIANLTHLGNYVNGSGAYEKIKNYDLIGGEHKFTVSRYEVYQLEY